MNINCDFFSKEEQSLGLVNNKILFGILAFDIRVTWKKISADVFDIELNALLLFTSSLPLFTKLIIIYDFNHLCRLLIPHKLPLFTSHLLIHLSSKKGNIKNVRISYFVPRYLQYIEAFIKKEKREIFEDLQIN